MPGGPSNEPSTENIAYWMGKVDTQLDSIQSAIQTLTQTDRANWREVKEWKTGVDARLARGSENFVRIDGRLEALEKRAAQTQLDIEAGEARQDGLEKTCTACQAIHIAEEKNSKKNGSGPLSKPVIASSSITYQWLLEKVLLPISLAGLTWFLLEKLPTL